MTRITIKAHPGHLTAGGFMCEPTTVLGREDIQVLRMRDIRCAVLKFGERLSNAMPGRSFLVSVIVKNGERKPNGFDRANDANEFGQMNWMRHEKDLAFT